MKRLALQWNDLNTRDKRSLIILAVFVVCMVAYLGLVEPFQIRIKALSAEKQKLAQNTKKNASAARSLARREAKLAETRLEYEYLLGKLDIENTGGRTMDEVVNDIKNFSSRVNVSVDQIRPMPPEDRGDYQEMPMEISVRSSFDAFLKFVYYIETSPQMLTISDLHIAREEQGIAARLSLSKFSLDIVSANSKSKMSAPIRIGLELWPGYAPFYIAEHHGWFEKEGLAIQLVHITDNERKFRLLETRDIEGAGLSLNSLIENLEKGLDIKAVYPLCWSTGAEAIVVAAESPIKQLDELKGKVLYVSGRRAEYLGHRAMEINGLDLFDVRFERMTPRMISQNLTTGMIESGVLRDPYLFSLANEKKIRVVFSSEEIPGEIMQTLAFRSDLVDTVGQEVLSRIIQVLQTSSDWIMENHKEASDIVAKQLNMTPKDAGKGLSKIHIPSRTEVGEIVGITEGKNEMSRFVKLQEKFLGQLYGEKIKIPIDVLFDWTPAAQALDSRAEKTEDGR